MKDRFDLLIFDWDGTLIDSVHWITDCLQNAARDSGLPVPQARLARSVIGLSLERAMETLFPMASPEQIGPLMSRYHRYYNAKPPGTDDLFAGVDAMLARLREQGYRLAVATGKSRPGLDQALQAAKATDWFHSTRTAGETASKPDPLMLLEIVAELALAPERTLVVGDSVYDLAMANNAGMACVGVASGAHDREELLAYQPLRVLDQATQLLELLI